MNRKKLIIYIITFANILMLSVVTFSETINMLEKKQEPNTTKSINKNIDVSKVDSSESEQTQKIKKLLLMKLKIKYILVLSYYFMIFKPLL